MDDITEGVFTATEQCHRFVEFVRFILQIFPCILVLMRDPGAGCSRQTGNQIVQKHMNGLLVIVQFPDDAHFLFVRNR
ncbi:hypothetical protein D3C87_2059920 [compost metagenome]